ACSSTGWLSCWRVRCRRRRLRHVHDRPMPIALTLLCLACVAVQIVADRRAWPRVRAVAKLGASSCFVALAVALGADQSAYGRLVLGALLLGWLGDALLLSRRPPAFMAGLGAFLLAHALYAAAFAGAAP